MLDFVTVAMVIVLPILTWSIYTVRIKKNYERHKLIQVATSIVLLIAVAAFEIDIRINGWRHLAEPSPYLETILYPFLVVHLVCAISTTIIWGYTIISAVRKMPRPSSLVAGKHKVFGIISASLMYMTAITGWIFYWMAFVAK